MNTKLLAAAATILAASTISAQGFTTPPGFLSTEGVGWQNVTTYGYAYYMGGYSDGRFQQLDGEIKTKGTQVLTSLGFRLDGRTHSASTAAGRSWTNVALSLADGDIATMTRTWTTNALTTPTTVFSGSVTWPSVAGATGTPAPWNAALRFNFSSPYIYTGTKDLLQDFQFTGGSLANAAAWATNNLKTYYLDGTYVLTSTTYGRSVYRTNNNNCVDSAIATTTSYASASVQVGLYGPLYTSNPSYTNTAQLQVFGSNTAPGAQVLQAIGLAGSSTGVNIGAKCNNLMIDMTQPTVIIADTTNNNSSASRTWQYLPLGSLPSLAKYGRTISIWSQGAWADSKTKQFSLTACDKCTPDFARKFNTSIPKRKTVYHYDKTGSTGFGPNDATAWYMQPITRYN